MSSTSSHLSWKSGDPEGILRAGLAKLNAGFQELTSQQWDPQTSTIGGVRDYQLCCLAPDPSGWSFLLLHLNSQLGDPLAAELSMASVGPVIVFHEFDQYAWGFRVYQKGNCIGRFWNCPEIVEEDPQHCTVSPDLIASSFGVPAEVITPYLKHLDPGADDPGKILPGDEFTLGDHWVRCDFMRHLGFRYPDPGEPGTRHVFIKERGVN